jgi:putative intracellular protease/amidase
VQLSDGSCLVEGKTVTGFANVEGDHSDKTLGRRSGPTASRTSFGSGERITSRPASSRGFAVRDGHLITDQQQYAGAKVAELVIAALGT